MSEQTHSTLVDSLRETGEIISPIFRCVAGIGSFVLGSELVDTSKLGGGTLMAAGIIILYNQQKIFRQKINKHFGN